MMTRNAAATSTRGAEVLWVEDVPTTIQGATLRLEVELGRGIVERVAYFREAEHALTSNGYLFLIVDLRLPMDADSSRNLVLDAGRELLISLKRGDYGDRNVDIPFAVHTA